MAAEQIETVRYRDVKYDLGTFVVSVKRLKDQGKPVAVIFNAVSAIISWKYPFTSVCVIPAVILMIVLRPEYLVGLLLIPLPLLMFVNLIKRLGTRKAVITDYQQLFVRKDESPEMIAKRAAMAKAREHLDMYLDILIEIQDLCNNISAKFELFYSLYYWKAWKQSLLFYLLVIGSLIGLFTIRIRYMVAILLFFLSVFNNGFKKIIVDIYMYIYNTPAKMSIAKADVFLDSSDEGEIEDVYQQELDMQINKQYPIVEDVDSSSSSDSDDLTIKLESKPEPSVHFEGQQEKQREKSGLSFVSKIASSTLASIRRRRAGGKCASCSSEFSTILKKRNYCRHCGYSYCSKCCRQRVPKVVFGATAPAAYEERVLVCHSCYAFLMNRMKGTNTEIVE